MDGDDGRLGGDSDQFEKAIGGSDLAVFELEALCLQDAEELLDDPALLVPCDDTPSVFDAGDRVGREPRRDLLAHAVCRQRPMQKAQLSPMVRVYHPDRL